MEDPPLLIMHYNAWRSSVSGGLDTMARFLRKARRRRCYFCHQAEASEAYYTSVCLRLADVGPVEVTGEKGGVKGGVKASSIGL